MKRRVLFLISLLAIIVTDLIGGEIRMNVETMRGRRNIEVNDIFYIEIQCSNTDVAPTQPSSVPGATVVYFDRTGTSSSFSSVNGKTTRSYSTIWTLTCRARKEGSYSFGPITAGGLKSNVVNYVIGKAQDKQVGTAASNNTGQSSQSMDAASDDTKPKFIGHGDQNLFLKAEVNKTTAYEQEALVYTVKLYTTYDAVKFIGATAAPKFDGFVVEESKDISTSLSYETYQGKTYATAVIARYIIFPQMSDALKIRGNTYTISVDRREYYHDPFWGNLAYSQPLQLNVTPNDLTINVKQLPAPKPAGFSGGVGKFSLTSTLKESELKTNQTYSIVYTISGSGNIKYIQMPDLGTIYPPQLEIYTPTSSQNVSVKTGTVSGTVSFDYSFMPLEEGNFSIPDVELVYFNPETNRYESSRAKGYKIEVGKGSGSAKSQVRKRIQFNHHLQPVNINNLKKERVLVVYKFSYWLMYIIPILIFCISLVWVYRYRHLHADMVAFNSSRADKLARRRLRKASAAMKKGDKELFITELLKALWGYLGNKLKMPNSELMRDNIRNMLQAQGISDEAIDNMINLIDNAEFAKYSSAGNSSDMITLYEEAVNAINIIEQAYKKVSAEKSKTN